MEKNFFNYFKDSGINDITLTKTINSPDEEKVFYETDTHYISKIDTEKGIITLKRKVSTL